MIRLKKAFAVFFIIVVALSMAACRKKLDYTPLSKYAEKELGFTEIYGITSSYASDAIRFVDFDMVADSTRVAFLYGEKDGKDTVYFFRENGKDYNEQKDLGNIFILSFEEIKSIILELWGTEQEYEYFTDYNIYIPGAYPNQLKFLKKPFDKEKNKIIYFYAFPEGSLKMYEGYPQEKPTYVKDIV